MNPDRWQRLDSLFHFALERKSEERAAFLDEACAGDQQLRREIEALIAANEQAGSFIEKDALEVEARSLANEQSHDRVESMVGKTIGHYRVTALLGSGGMGEVYLTQDTVLGRTVALKLLPASLTKDPDRLRRFEQEARAASALNHPNILTIYEVGQAESVRYIATEFIDGETLRQRITGFRARTTGVGSSKSGTPLVLREVLDVAIQTADALAAAHEAGIVHRDIKPENIMVRRRDRYVKVLDFGLAKLTEGAVDSEAPTRAQVKTSVGMVMGTASYMSPEQARGEKVDARTDIWSLGVVLYEMLAGCTPFERSTQNEVLASILGDKEPPPLARYSREVPAELERIVSKALSKDRESRYQTAKDLLVDLRRLRQRLEVEAEIERTAEPEKISKAKAVAASSEETAGATAGAAAIATGDAAIARSTSSAAYLVQRIKLRKRGALIILAVLVAVTIAVAYFAYSRYAGGGRAGMSRSIAVLPFTNASNNPDTEYLSDGVSESLINSLSQLPGVKVIARSSSFKYRGKDPQDAANALGVEAILTGRVAQRGENLLIGVELVDARDKTQVWGAQYNRKATDLVAVQSEISSEIAEALRVRLTSTDQQRLTKRATQNSEAYQLYLNGLFFDRKKEAESLRKAVDYYNRAIALDPNFALAYAGMSSTYTFLAESGVDTKEALSLSKAAAMKALELDDTLAEAHWALANIKANEWDWAGAEDQYKRAIELNPSLAVAHYDYAYYLSCLERHSEALAEIKRAQELDPLNVHFRATEGFILMFARQYDEAIQQLQRVLKAEPENLPGHMFLGYTYSSKRLYPEAIAEYQRTLSLEKESTSTECYLGYAYAMSGKRNDALALLQKLKTTKEYVSPAELAILHVGLGDKEEALDLLEKAYQAHDLQLRHLKVDPHYDSLRADPRFADLGRRVGLPQ